MGIRVAEARPAEVDILLEVAVAGTGAEANTHPVADIAAVGTGAEEHIPPKTGIDP